MKTVFHHIIILVLFFTGLAQQHHAQTGIFKGKVHGAAGVLQAATVSLGNKTTFTNENGEFLFTVKAGLYTFTISHAGYKQVEQRVKVEAGNTQAVDFTLAAVEEMGEVVVTGSRSTVERTNLNTPVPVDVISYDQLLQTNRSGLTQMLNFAVPSFNASRELLNESITLRGLNPDQVLILVNGTRYHNMAYINASEIRGHLGKGSVANDINSIPFSAIEKIEILRDGASAQYGSDAIAGVINIILKESTGKTSVLLQGGQYYKGDGENISLGINHGIDIGKTRLAGRQGFLNFSADFRYRDYTNRGGEFKGTVYSADTQKDDSITRARNFDRNNPSNAGNSALNSFGISMNGSYPAGDKTELFWTFAVNSRKNTFIGGFVFPKNIRRVNTDLFPDGFKPRVIQTSLDILGIAGAKGVTRNRWRWEWNSAWGSNTGDYKPENTNNASQYYTLGKNAPTKFYTGSLIYRQLVNNINFTKGLAVKPGSITSFNVGYGFEWRLENFQIKEGEEAAWENYDSLGRKEGGVQNGLILQPDNVVNENRNVFGAYIDLESEFNARLLVTLAVRYEYYTDFGSNLSGKAAFRHKISDHISLRGSISNGFRAPGLQQRFYSTTTNGVTSIGGTVTSAKSGIFRNDSEVAQAFGVPSLQAEKALNLGLGFTARLLNRVSLTVDAYWIRIKDRIIQSGNFNRRTNSSVDSILSEYQLDVEQLQFFTNAINTKTGGIDIILNSTWKIKKSILGVMFGVNFTRTRLFGEIKTAEKLPADSLNNNTLFGRLDRTRVERGQPDHKVILSLNYKTGRLGFLLRNTVFGKTTIASFSFPNDPGFDESFSSKILTDIGIDFSPKKWLTLTAGVNNVLDVYPDRINNYVNTGEGQFIYGMEASPFGFNGGYYFVNMSFNF